MLGFHTPGADRGFAGMRHGGRTPAPGMRIFDQNSGLLPQTGGRRKATAVPFTPARLDIGKEALGTSKALRTGSRALQDKTPFPNRQQAQIIQPLFSKLNNKLHLSPEEESLELDKSRSQRPSSTRRSLKLPRSVNRSFDATSPASNITHSFDISDVNIGNISAVDSIPEEPAEDTDEPEYMPPTAIESSWEPDFELPDFQQLGTALTEFSRAALQPYDPEDFVDDHAFADACGWGVWDKIDIPELDSDDDCPFEKPPVKVAPKNQPRAKPGSRPPATSRPVAGKSSAATTSRPPVASRRAPPLPSKQPPARQITDFGLGESDIVDEF